MQNNLSLIVSIYAAIVSTIVFLWRLYEFYDDKRGKIKLELARRNQAIVYGNHSLGEWEVYLNITAINLGKYKRLIEMPTIKANKKVEGKDEFRIINFDDTTKFPVVLESGEKFEYLIQYKAVLDFKKNGVSKIKAIIIDTHGKSYTSNWLNI